ncbi:MAG: hypothetical protein ACE5HI_10935, partial [bacterium]
MTEQISQINSFMVGVTTSVIATILTSLGWFFWNKLKRRDKLLSFLGLNLKQNILICYGNIHKERLVQSDNKVRRDYATFEYGDIASTLIVYDRLTPACTVKHAVGSDLSVASEGNIIAIGGPKWNKITEHLLGRIGSPFYFKQGVSGTIEKRKAHQNENLHSIIIEQQSDGSVRIKDYGFILCARAHFLGDNLPFAMVIVGYSTYGVLTQVYHHSSLSSMLTVTY